MRYIPHTTHDVERMLAEIGVDSEDRLFDSIPERLRLKEGLALPEPLDEQALLEHLGALAARNKTSGTRFFLGGGIYRHYSPTIINELIHRAEFYTAYTPYQPEISQGTLQAMFEYQSMICRLLGTEVSNASMYDGSTAFTEAWFMSVRSQKGKRRKLLVAGSVHPEYLEVLKTYMLECDTCVEMVQPGPDGVLDLASLEAAIDQETAAVAIQSPNFFGLLEDVEAIGRLAHDKGALLVASFTEALAFGLIEPPGRLGADIVVGEGQSLGISMSLGGPGLGIMACRKDLVRNMPGRIIGQTVDKNGRRGFCITLATREQHIRREKATSNICTNQGLCALIASIYMSLMGPDGLTEVAKKNHISAQRLARALASVPGVSLLHPKATFFNEFVVRLPVPAAQTLAALSSQGIAGGIALSDHLPDHPTDLLVTATELTTEADILTYQQTLADILK